MEAKKINSSILRRRKQCFSVKNVKVHIHIGSPISIPDCLQSFTKVYSNFVVVRLDGLVFVIFRKNGYINVSGIRHFSAIKDVVLSINFHFGLNIVSEDIVVDNSTASGRLRSHHIDLRSIHNSPLADKFNISIRPYYFPSAIIRDKSQPNFKSTHQRRYKKSENFATCILFSNGKFIIVGGKNISMIQDSFHQLCALTSTL